jgi:hypothetical protein
MTEATLFAWWVLQSMLALATGAHAIPPVCN